MIYAVGREHRQHDRLVYFRFGHGKKSKKGGVSQPFCIAGWLAHPTHDITESTHADYTIHTGTRTQTTHTHDPVESEHKRRMRRGWKLKQGTEAKSHRTKPS